MTNNNERLIDLMVDGELSDAERRDLLEQLDAMPDGWRHCALAFVEAQTLRQAIRSEVGQLISSTTSAGAVHVEHSKRKGRWGSPRAVRPMFVFAATCLAAFTLGWLAHPLAQRPLVLAPVATTAPHQDSNNGLEAASSDLKSSPLSSISPSEDAPDVHVVGLLSWTIERDGKEQHLRVPVVAGEGIDEEWLRRQPSAVPDSMRRDLERRGHKLVTNRQLMSIELADGRRAILPVEQVEVRTKGRVYQ